LAEKSRLFLFSEHFLHLSFDHTLTNSVSKVFEAFEKCPILFKAKAILQDSRIGQLLSCPKGRGAWTPRVNAKILTTGRHWVFWGLKFEPDAGIGQKGVFCKGLYSGPMVLGAQRSSKPLDPSEKRPFNSPCLFRNWNFGWI